MTSKANQRVKRKNEFSDLKIEPSLKALKKDDIIARFIALQSNYNNLEKKNRSLEEEKKVHLEAIQLLEETVKVLETTAKKDKVETSTKDIQTITFETDIIRCNECDYPADDLVDLGEHMYEFHTENPFCHISCFYCDENFKNENNLMKHRKLVHEEKVKDCNLFMEGICPFGDECWYKHQENSRKQIPEYKCRICQKTFNSKVEFMKHRKSDHIEIVPICRNSSNGPCSLGTEICWFRHDNEYDNDVEMIEAIVSCDKDYKTI